MHASVLRRIPGGIRGQDLPFFRQIARDVSTRRFRHGQLRRRAEGMSTLACGRAADLVKA
jgi:hypothetical protein